MTYSPWSPKADWPGWIEGGSSRQFAAQRMNLINMWKEYFRTSTEEIVTFAKAKGVEVEITKLAEARQFRESEAIRLKAQQNGKAPEASQETFPDSLFVEDEED